MILQVYVLLKCNTYKIRDFKDNTNYEHSGHKMNNNGASHIGIFSCRKIAPYIELIVKEMVI